MSQPICLVDLKEAVQARAISPGWLLFLADLVEPDGSGKIQTLEDFKKGKISWKVANCVCNRSDKLPPQVYSEIYKEIEQYGSRCALLEEEVF